MNKFKKLLKSACSILMAFVMVFAIGIGCVKEDDDAKVIIKPAPEQPAPTFELSQTQIECIVGDVKKLTPNSLPDIGEASLSWRSEDSSVVTIDNNGNIEAINEGTTKVIATYGTATAECTVKVSWDDEMPQIVSPAGAEENFSIVVGQEYSFAPTINYRGKTYTDAQFSIDVSDIAVTALDAKTSTITGATNGNSSVTISGTWRGKEALRATYNVTVSGDVVLSAADAQDNIFPIDQVELYTDAKSFDNMSDQPTSIQFVPTAKIRTDIDSEPTTVNMNDNPEYFSVEVADNRVNFNSESKTLEAVSFGDTIATIKFNYDGQTYVKQFNIHLERPTADFSRKVNFFSSNKGTLRDEDNGFKDITLKELIYGDQEETIETAFIDDQELQIEESTGAIFGITGTSASAYDVSLKVGTDVEQYNVNMAVYGQYVYESTDLDVFVRTAASPELDIYVELARDLDLSNYVRPAHFNDVDTSSSSTDPNKDIIPNHRWSTTKMLAKGFMGTFDGKGHYLMNYTQANSYGFFEGLYEATIKNVGFVNCASDAQTFMAAFANDITMENVYVKLTRMKKGTNYWSVGVISQYYSPGGTYSNVYIDLEDANVSVNLPEGRNRYYWEVYSSFVHFPLVSDVQPVFNNCLVISKAPLSSTGFELGEEGPRFVVADNMSEEDRVALRQQVWNGQDANQQSTMTRRYNSRYNSDKLSIYPNPNNFDDPSLVLENFNNSYLSKYSNDVTRASSVGKVAGVRSYNTMADMKKDATSKDYISNFSNEYWTIVDGELTWGKHPADLNDGDVFLDVGELAGKQVEGITQNPIDRVYVAGDTVEVGALSCFGYIFKGWKNNTTGEMLTQVDNKWTFTYSGKATILIAQWEIDPDVQVGSGVK